MDSNVTIKTTKVVYPQVYAYTLPTTKEREGWIKIGYTERENVDIRIKEQVHTAAINLKYEKLWFDNAKFNNVDKWFTDKQFHAYLRKFKNIENEKNTEWFYYNGTPSKSKEDFYDFKNSKLDQSNEEVEYTLRYEQELAVEQTLSYFSENENSEYLWNAKPRFGKTLTSYDLVRKLNATNVLIVTNRPAIANSWFDDFQKFIAWQSNYKFVSTADSLKERPVLTRTEFIEQLSEDSQQIAFISLQDLKGAISFGGNFDKLSWVKDLEWDLLIVDEAHEGIDTLKTDVAFDQIKRKFTLHLSGTPFKAIATGKFNEEQIFNWTYADEQESKVSWNNVEENNPYEKLPKLNLFSYQISNMITDEINKGANIEGKQTDYAFDLNEFFETKENGKFVYEEDIIKWLDALTRNEKYPFSTKELRNELKHTFWILNRVASAKALQKLLQEHPVFENYKIILAAGDGRAFDDEIISNEKSFERVKEAIKNNDKTITLSVGQLTTGVTIPEWTAVLMLSNMTSPSLYMQSAFRSQNPWEYEVNGVVHQKKNAYVFDFAPERTLIIYDEFANNLSKKTSSGGGTSDDREKNIKELLNFFPVIAEDNDGKMVELDVNQVLTIPKTIKAKEVIKRGFMSNFLFQNVSGIFASAEAREILELLNPYDAGKFTPRNSETKIDTQDVQVDDDGKVEIDETLVIKETEARFGDKVYASILEKVVDEIPVNPNTLSSSIANTFKDTIESATKELAKDNGLTTKFAERVVEENSKIIAREIEVVKKNAEIKQAEVTIEYEKRIKEAVNDEVALEEARLNYENLSQKIADEFKEKVEETIEIKSAELVEKTTETILTKAEDKKKNTVEDDIRDRLRGFARTIPSFLMAYGNENTTLSNFSDLMSNDVFKETTGISIMQFIELRDTYNFFDEIVFNESVQEFMRKRIELANYFDESQEECIFDYIPPQRTNQIFTPKKVVKMMIDNLEKDYPDDFKNPNKTFADLYVKSGLYLAEIVKRLYIGLENVILNEEERLKHILENQIYGFAPSEIIYNIAKNYVFGFDISTKTVSNNHIVLLDMLPFAKNETNLTLEEVCITEFGEEFKNMKFDVVVGNPPYQQSVSNSGSNQHDMPVYNYFYDLAEKISDKYALISPARFLTGSGYTPKVWNEKMLNDKHLKISYYNPKSSEVFPNTDIKGGVVVLCRDKHLEQEPIEFFTPNPILTKIALKVIHQIKDKSLKDIMYVQSKMDLDVVYKDFPKFKDTRPKSSISDARFGTDALTLFADMLSEVKDNEYSFELFGLLPGNKRSSKYINPKYLLTTDETSTRIDKYKVLVPKASGSGMFGETISTPVIGIPNMGHTMSFRSIGAFDSNEEAENVLKYIKTKFTRSMIGSLKSTQDMPPKVFSHVPLQDFTNSSDIDWTKSIQAIDQQLYKKYNLTQEEIEFIETNVKEME